MSTHEHQTEQMYTAGVAAFRAAQWQEAIDTFLQLHTLGGGSAETEALLADAQLKLGLERSHVAVVKSPPKQRRIRKPLALVAGIALVGLAITWYSFAAAANDLTVVARTLEPTNIAQRATQQPASSTQAGLPLATAPQSGTLLVRWAADQPGQQVVQTVEVILDASGSMLGRVGTHRRIELAHTALEQLVAQMPATTQIALRTYGRNRRNDCSDAELVRPLGPLDRAAFISDVRATIPVPEARTPLAFSIAQTAQDLHAATGNIMIVVVSDGDETCDGDPARAAEQLHQNNPNIRVNVVGFAVGSAVWSTRLRETARRGGGTYFDAADSAQLAAALQSAVAPTYQLRNSQGVEVFSGALGKPAALPGGQYRLAFDGVLLPDDPIMIEAGQTIVLDVRKAAGVIKTVVSADSTQP